MKFRIGFVSNSSTTSFCLYGKYFDNKDITEEQEEKLEAIGLSVLSDQNDYGKYTGRSFTAIKDEETGKEFKERTLKDFQKIFPEIEQLEILEDGWYDG